SAQALCCGGARPCRLSSLSLHDALPISRAEPPPANRPRRAHRRLSVRRWSGGGRAEHRAREPRDCVRARLSAARGSTDSSRPDRSEEHTSELQSRFDLVCRLLLETKKKP